MLREHEWAILSVDLPEFRLQAGDIGTVVHIYNGGSAYEMEFTMVDGQTLDVITVGAAQLLRYGVAEFSMRARLSSSR